MYEIHFGLTGQPFGMTPDPRYFYQGSAHREAFAALKYGIHERRGFMILVGEVGTGKTTLINTLLDEIDRSTCTILVTHTTVDREELLRIILFRLIESHGPRIPAQLCPASESSTSARLSTQSRIELINEFSAFVNGESMAFRPPPLLIIDEAQNLSPQVLEEVRLLTNLEGPRSKLLQVILAGQPELEQTLLRHELRQLRQRIAVHARLDPLGLEETIGYIAHRLNQAGCERPDVFNRAALEAIYEASKGSPRTINVLCDYALVNAFGAGEQQVDEALALEAVQDVMRYRADEPKLEKPRPYLVTHLDDGPVQKAAGQAAMNDKKRGKSLE
jgi:general secretion pathway protein A